MQSRFRLRGEAHTSTLAPAGIRQVRLSTDRATLSSLERKLMAMREVFGTTSGRTLRLCGDIGATMNTFASGVHIGPPTLRE